MRPCCEATVRTESRKDAVSLRQLPLVPASPPKHVGIPGAIKNQFPVIAPPLPVDGAASEIVVFQQVPDAHYRFHFGRLLEISAARARSTRRVGCGDAIACHYCALHHFSLRMTR